MSRTKPKAASAAPDGGNIARARDLVPGLNGGQFLEPWKPGESGNPSGRPAGLRAVQRAAREKTPDALRYLARVIDDDGGDRRSGIVAAQTILTWAYGKPPEFDPKEDRQGAKIDITRLPREQRRAFMDLLRAMIVAEPVAGPTEIEGQVAEATDDDVRSSTD
ncbi:MAG: hypothetical protein JO122_17570 [Acetobacteraceae bacterium]|nr:hypothetical protein [Acetobacteraceae bacterium]